MVQNSKKLPRGCPQQRQRTKPPKLAAACVTTTAIAPHMPNFVFTAAPHRGSQRLLLHSHRRRCMDARAHPSLLFGAAYSVRAHRNGSATQTRTNRPGWTPRLAAETEAATAASSSTRVNIVQTRGETPRGVFDGRKSRFRLNGHVLHGGLVLKEHTTNEQTRGGKEGGDGTPTGAVAAGSEDCRGRCHDRASGCSRCALFVTVISSCLRPLLSPAATVTPA